MWKGLIRFNSADNTGNQSSRHCCQQWSESALPAHPPQLWLLLSNRLYPQSSTCGHKSGYSLAFNDQKGGNMTKEEKQLVWFVMLLYILSHSWLLGA